MATVGGVVVLTCAILNWTLIRGLSHLRRIAAAAEHLAVEARRIAAAAEDTAENTRPAPDPWTALQETKRAWRAAFPPRRGAVPGEDGPRAGER